MALEETSRSSPSPMPWSPAWSPAWSSARSSAWSSARGRRLRRSLLLAALLAPWGAFQVGGTAAAGAGFERPVELGLFAGLADGVEDGQQDLEIGAEALWPTRFERLGKVVGLSVTEQRALYAYAGVRWALPVGEGWQIVPGFAAGLYTAGDGKDLGHVLEFRSSLELTRALSPRFRIGAVFYHISNASISSRNPGRNSLLVSLRW